MATLRSNFEVAAESVSPLLYLDYKKYLDDIFQSAKTIASEEGRSYSYVQFSEDLGFSKSNVLHLIIQGKRPLTKKSGNRISEVLNLKDSAKIYFEALVSYHNEKNSQERENLFEILMRMKSKELFTQVDLNQFEYFSEWFHPVVRELVSHPDFQESSDWICDRIFPKIKPEQARKSLHLLQQLKMVVRDESSGRLRPSATHVATPGYASGIALIRYHQKLIELGRDSLVAVQSEERDVSSLSFTLTEVQYEKVVQEIKEFRKKIVAALDETSAGSKKVYALNFQFFPLTHKL
jgi:uncharacterized protein (TIGR02147 family)